MPRDGERIEPRFTKHGKRAKKPGPPKRFDHGTVGVRITKEQARELRLVRKEMAASALAEGLGRVAVEDSDAVRHLIDWSIEARRERALEVAELARVPLAERAKAAGL